MKIKKRELITVQLPDGYKIRISNRAKSDGIKLSDIVRRAIREFLRPRF